jgi:AcrR family transcriptional regulator
VDEAGTGRRETRDRIVRAAEELFAAHGYDAVSVAAVSDAAGVTERTVFRYFPEKQGLVYPEAGTHLTMLRTELRVRAVDRRISHELLADAVVAVFTAVVAAGEADRIALRGRLISESADLRAGIYGMLSDWRDAVADELLGDVDGDVAAATVAAATVVTDRESATATAGLDNTAFIWVSSKAAHPCLVDDRTTEGTARTTPGPRLDLSRPDSGRRGLVSCSDSGVHPAGR